MQHEERAQNTKRSQDNHFKNVKKPINRQNDNF